MSLKSLKPIIQQQQQQNKKPDKQNKNNNNENPLQSLITLINPKVNRKV